MFLSNVTGGCDTTWSFQNLTTLAGATNLTAPFSKIATIGASNDALQSQFYVGNIHHLYRMYWPSSGGVFNQDLTGVVVPNAVSGIAAIVNAGNCPHVFYVDTSQHVRDTFQTNLTGGGCTTTWSTADLTINSGAGNLAETTSPISVLGPTSESLQQQIYVGSDHHLYRFYWPSTGGVINQDLTGATGAPLVSDSSGTAAIINAGGCPHVFYIDVNQHVSSVFLGNITGGCTASWNYQDLTNISGASNLAFATSPLTALGPTIDALQSQFYIGANNDIFRISWPSSGGTFNQDITLLAH